MAVKGSTKLDPLVRRTLGEHGGLVRASELFEAGVHPRTLYGLRNAGELEQVAHGLYRAASAPLPPHFDLLVVSKRAPHAAICLISALAFHELTDEIPHEVSIAIPRGSTPPRIESPPIHIYRYARGTFALGIEHHRIEGTDLKVYSPGRSIVDAFRFRNRIGEDVAIKALAAGVRDRRVRAGQMLELASKLRARAIIEPYLKALTS